ncbi:ascorbate-specific PTS system IIC component [Spiroplasma eriocheiris CCTCC M 207170]|nr:ascorbate-specific PTS system IIC component [Spiroplasma eriocheiris CCTCC M 207170]
MLNTDGYSISGGTEFMLFLNSFFGEAALLVGLICLIGQLIQRKSFSDVVVGTFKCIIGFFILEIGSSALKTTLGDFTPVFKNLVTGPDGSSITAQFASNEAIFATIGGIIPSIMTVATGIMVIAILLNIAMAALTRFRYVYLTGHVLYYMSIAFAAAILVGISGALKAEDYVIIIIGGATFLSFYAMMSSAANQRFLRYILGRDSIAVAHTGSLSFTMAGYIGLGFNKLAKGKVKSTENMNVPKTAGFLKEGMITTALSMLIFYILIFCIAYGVRGINAFIGTSAGPSSLNAYAKDPTMSWFALALIDGFKFAAGTQILVFGVKMFVGQLVPAFKGFAEKVVKRGRAGVDVALTWVTAPNATVIGFITSFAGGIVGFALTFVIAKFAPQVTLLGTDNMYHAVSAIPVVLPGIVGHFFIGAGAGVYGNSRGGIWGALVAPFLSGVIITFIPCAFYAANMYAGPDYTIRIGAGWSDTDFIWALIPGAFALINKWVVLIVGIALVIGTVAGDNIRTLIQKKKGTYRPAGAYTEEEMLAKFNIKPKEFKIEV